MRVVLPASIWAIVDMLRRGERVGWGEDCFIDLYYKIFCLVVKEKNFQGRFLK